MKEVQGLQFCKETSKSIFYRIGKYKISIPKEDKFVFRRPIHNRHLKEIDYDTLMIPCCTVTIENIETKKKSRKRCVQELDQLYIDLENDYNRKRSQFTWP